MVTYSVYILILFMVVQSLYSASGSGIERLCPIPIGGWSSPCHTACTNDLDCPNNKKCCILSTCATYCAVPILIDAYGVVTSTTTSPYPSTESEIMSEHNVTAEVLKTNMSQYQYEVTERPIAGKQSTAIKEVTETNYTNITTFGIKNTFEVTESPPTGIPTSGTKNMSQYQNEMTTATSTDILKTETTNMSQYQNEMTTATSTYIPKTETTDMSQYQNEVGEATSTDIPKTETTYGSQNQKELIRTHSTDIPTYGTKSISPYQFEVTETKITHSTNLKRPEISVSSSSTAENKSAVSSNKCHTECNRNSDCETGFLCVKLGCHQVCKIHIFRNIAFYKQLNNPNEIFDIFMQIYRNSLNLAKVETNSLSINKAGCRKQCDTDADCNHGYCVHVNCHSICRRKIVIKY